MDSSTTSPATVNDKRVAVKVMLPKSIDRAVEMEAVKRDWTKQDLMQRAIVAYLNRLNAAGEAA
jgi:hypothetical protein